MKKYYKVLKIEKDGKYLNIWIKGDYKKITKKFIKYYNDGDFNFLTPDIDVTGKYTILRFILRNKEDILPYIKYSV